MNKDKKVIYAVSLVAFAVLFISLFFGVKNSRIFTACLLVPLTFVVRALIRKRCSYSVNKKEVFVLAVSIGALYAILVQMSGLIFGYYKNPYFVTPKILLTVIIPMIAIIVATEIIRSTELDQKNALVSIIAFATCLVAEVLAFSNVAGITSFNKFMDLVGLTLFPAISANACYHFISKRFGMLPNIAFRLILNLHAYFTLTVTAMPDALLACVKIFIPFILMILVSTLYSKKKKNALQKGSKLGAVATTLSVVVILSVAALVSCHFRFGAIVIATESMTGEINKGDVIIYERYDGQEIEEGQVIVFNSNGNRIIHRVVRIERIGNEVRYYTKGDANESLDMGYRTEADIVGLTDVKVAHIGYPTLWLRDLLESKN